MERPSRSTVKIRVGQYQDGRDRIELRHFNDLKLAHPDSAVSPVSRPKLGRPPTSPSEVSKPTEESELVPKPPNRLSPTINKQPPLSSTGRVHAGNNSSASHATSTQESRVPPSAVPQQQLQPSRPVRSTRNPHPQYVDSFHRPWSASPSDIRRLNELISRGL